MEGCSLNNVFLAGLLKHYHADGNHDHLYNLTLSALGLTLDVRIEF